MREELEAARLNEANMRMEMEQMKLRAYAADSVKLAYRGCVSIHCVNLLRVFL